MTEQPDNDQQNGDQQDDLAEAQAEAFDATVHTEDNTGGFKPGRDDVEENGE